MTFRAATGPIGGLPAADLAAGYAGSRASPVAARSVLLGGAVAAGMVLAMATGVPLLERLGGAVVLLSAVLDPAAGLAAAAVLLTQRDSSWFGPLGFQVLLVLAAAFGLVLRLPIDRPRLSISAPFALALVFVVVAAVSLVPAVNGYPWSQVASGIALLLAIVAALGVVAIAVVCFQVRDPTPYLGVGLASLVLAAAVAIAVFASGPAIGFPLRGLISQTSFDTRAFGPFYNSNYLGFALAQGLVLAAGWLAVARRRLPLAVVVLVLGVGLLLTFSRGALLAAGAGLLVLAYLRSRLAALLLLGLGAGLVLFVGPLLLQTRVGITFGEVSANASAGQALSDAWRLNALEAGFRLFERSPIFGVGFGQYHFLSPRFLDSTAVTYSHNAYMTVLAEQGIAGALVVAGIVVALIAALRRSSHRLAGATLAVLACYLTGSFFIDSVTSLQASAITWLALAVVLAPRELRPEAGVPSQPGRAPAAGEAT